MWWHSYFNAPVTRMVLRFLLFWDLVSVAYCLWCCCRYDCWYYCNCCCGIWLALPTVSEVAFIICFLISPSMLGVCTPIFPGGWVAFSVVGGGGGGGVFRMCVCVCVVSMIHTLCSVPWRDWFFVSLFYALALCGKYCTSLVLTLFGYSYPLLFVLLPFPSISPVFSLPLLYFVCSWCHPLTPLPPSSYYCYYYCG